MGGGSWSASSYVKHHSSTTGAKVTSSGVLDYSGTAQDLFKARCMDAALNPYKAMRECRDSDEHPNTLPVILALDVTGSMGKTSVEVAKQLNVIMTNLYNKVSDVEFMIMAIGDLAYDHYPIQASQFESDIRIAEQLDKVYFEGGGGGNSYESYTAAWFFGLYHCDLDCWKRDKKGIIITLGDETLNPYLPKERVTVHLGDNLQDDVNTDELYKKASEKYDIYHISVSDGTQYSYYQNEADESFSKVIGADHYKVATLNSLSGVITDIVSHSNESVEISQNSNAKTEEIVW